jgi:molybdate transport system substrate-binding protein
MKPRAALFLLLAPLLATVAAAAELTVFAAASLSDALTEIAPLYAKSSGHTLVFNFGSSGTLARQIKEGAPADLMFSADELRLDQLAKENLLLPGTRRTLLTNTLVLIIPAGKSTPATFAELANPAVRRIALGHPDTVPAGTYARTHLRTLELWDPLQPKFVFLDNVRSVLAAVEAGNADAGIVYRTDALASKKVKTSVSVPHAEGPAITYPAAVVQSSPSPDLARELLTWLASATATEVFTRHGFLPAPTPDTAP